ncbi:MAG: hypothetical protein N2485_04000 [bacterium]|nr:hypothetical protein [bacterium]
MLRNSFISIDKKIYSLISLPLKIVLTIIEKDEDLKDFDFKIIISDKINFSYLSANENNNEKIEIPTEISKDNIKDFMKILNDNKIRVINIKKEENLLKIYIAKEIYELLN